MIKKYSFTQGQQPCQGYNPQQSTIAPDMDNKHQCYKCGGTVSFCDKCVMDHHEDGWDTCGVTRDSVADAAWSAGYESAVWKISRVICPDCEGGDEPHYSPDDAAWMHGKHVCDGSDILMFSEKRAEAS